MEYTVVISDNRYMLQDTCGQMYLMPKPWSAFLPNDRVCIKDNTIRLVHREEQSFQCVVYGSHNHRIKVSGIQYPHFKKSLIYYKLLPIGTLVRVHVNSYGATVLLDILHSPIAQPPQPETPAPICSPPSPSKALAMPMFI